MFCKNPVDYPKLLIERIVAKLESNRDPLELAFFSNSSATKHDPSNSLHKGGNSAFSEASHALRNKRHVEHREVRTVTC